MNPLIPTPTEGWTVVFAVDDEEDEVVEEEEDDELVVPSPGHWPSPCPDVSTPSPCRCACVSATPCTQRIAARMNDGTLRQAKTRPGGTPELVLALVLLLTRGQRGLGGRDKDAGEKGMEGGTVEP